MHGPAIHENAGATIDGLIEYCVNNRVKETAEG
jgi:hypothetical protein